MITPTLQTTTTAHTTVAPIHANKRTWIELSKQAFDHNVTMYKKIIGAAVQLAVVVKGNAYGHGLQEIAQLCQESPAVDWLCITSLSEALQLRSHGITKPLLVLCILDEQATQAIEHDIDLVVYDIETIIMLSELGSKLKKNVYVHLKIDTGLSRFGFFASDALSIITRIKCMPFIVIRGICSHFAESDNANQSFTNQQLATFTHLIDQLTAHNISIPLRHASNSAATTSLAQSHGTFVRLGAGAYGLHPSAFTVQTAQELHHNFELKPVMTWKTTIMHIRTIPANIPVGYGTSYTTKYVTTIAIIPIGYFEGYDRRLSNKGTVRITTADGLSHYAPVIGRVCMNVTIIDITHVTNTRCGDEVTVLGNYPSITAHEIAHTMQGFNPREVTTRINAFIPRMVTT